jgi:ketosteroid isomerase-like protein
VDEMRFRRGLRAGCQSQWSHTFEPTSMEVTVVGDTAYEVGAYKMELTPQGSLRISNVGKYLMVWKRTSDGPWRILRDMYNTNEAPPANK